MGISGRQRDSILADFSTLLDFLFFYRKIMAEKRIIILSRLSLSTIVSLKMIFERKRYNLKYKLKSVFFYFFLQHTYL